MTSGTIAGSNALSHKTLSPADKSRENLSVRSPSPFGKPSASPRQRSRKESVSANDKVDSGSRAASDDGPANGVNGHNESEAETEILSDTEQNKTKGKKKVIKGEDDVEHVRTRLSTSPRHSRKHSDVAAQANGSVERRNADRNGHKRVSNGERHEERAKSKSASPSNTSQSKTATESVDGRRKSPSVDTTAPSPTVASSDRGRTSSISGPRKRKIREEHHLRNIEPPRQRLKSDPSTKSPATHNLRGQPTSPAQTSPGLRSHKRSQSTQSVLTSANKLKRKELSSAQDRKQWRSDTSSNASSSPQPTPTAFQHPATRTKRSSHRSVTSPARTTSHMGHPKKNVDKFGATRLAREAEKGNMKFVREAYDLAPEELDQSDFAGFAPLQKAALNGHADVVEFLLKKGCRTDCHSKEHDTPLIDAVENGHVEVVKLLLDAGVNPHFQNKKGERALDVLNNDEDDVEEIETALLKAMREHSSDDDDGSDSPVLTRDPVENQERNDLLYVESTISNLRKYAAKGDAVAVDHFLNSVMPDNACAIAAARGGHEIVLNLLLASASPRLEKDMDPSKHEETPLTVAIGRGHLGVLRMLLDQDNFNPMRRNKEGKTYYELAEERRGPKWQQEMELLKEHFDHYKAKRAAKKRKLDAHPAEKAAKIAKLRSPKSPEAKKTARTSSPAPSETKTTSTSVKPPKIKKEQTADGTATGHRRPSIDLHGKRGKVVTPKELGSPRDAKARRRRVVDDDESSDSDHPATDAPKKLGRPPGRPRKSSDVAPARSRKDVTSPSASREKLADKERRRASMSKRKDAQKEKENKQDDEEMPDAPPEPSPPKEEVKEVTPDPVRLRRIAEAEKEAQRERLAAERARLVEEQRIAEIKHKEWLARIAKLPNALRHACEKGKNRPLHFSGEEMGVSMTFLPIHTVPLAHLDPECIEGKRTEEWMPSFQAVGVLGLREMDMTRNPSTSKWQTSPFTEDQKKRFLKTYDISQLAQDAQAPCEDSPDFDPMAVEQNIVDTRQKFLAIEPLTWVRYEDFVKEVAEQEWLNDLSITKTACCMTTATGAETPRSFEDMILGLKGIVKQQQEAVLTPPSATSAAIEEMKLNGIAETNQRSPSAPTGDIQKEADIQTEKVNGEAMEVDHEETKKELTPPIPAGVV